MSNRPEAQEANVPSTTCPSGASKPLSPPRNPASFPEQACRIIRPSACKYTRITSDEFKGAVSLNLSIGKILGRGAYANVKAVYCDSSNRLMALKIVNKRVASSYYLSSLLPNEIHFLCIVSHPHIITTHHIVETEHKVFILMDLAQNGELADYISSRKRLPECEAHYLFTQIVEGVKYLHSNGIAHRDLKCDNILLDHDMSIKIADFGFVTNATRCPVATACGSYAYAAPELFSRDTESYDALKTDVWSLGVVLFAMLSGRLVFGSDATAKRNLNNRQVLFPPAIPFTDTLKDLILRMLRMDPSSRLTCREVAEHVWVTSNLAVKPAQPLKFSAKYTTCNLCIQYRFYKDELIRNGFSSAELLAIPSPTDLSGCQ